MNRFRSVTSDEFITEFCGWMSRNKAYGTKAGVVSYLTESVTRDKRRSLEIVESLSPVEQQTFEQKVRKFLEEENKMPSPVNRQSQTQPKPPEEKAPEEKDQEQKPAADEGQIDSAQPADDIEAGSDKQTPPEAPTVSAVEQGRAEGKAGLAQRYANLLQVLRPILTQDKKMNAPQFLRAMEKVEQYVAKSGRFPNLSSQFGQTLFNVIEHLLDVVEESNALTSYAKKQLQTPEKNGNTVKEDVSTQNPPPAPADGAATTASPNQNTSSASAVIPPKAQMNESIFDTIRQQIVGAKAGAVATVELCGEQVSLTRDVGTTILEVYDAADANGQKYLQELVTTNPAGVKAIYNYAVNRKLGFTDSGK